MVNIFIVENWSQIVHIEDHLKFYNSKLSKVSGYYRWTDPYVSSNLCPVVQICSKRKQHYQILKLCFQIGPL